MKKLIATLILAAASMAWASTYARPSADANSASALGCSGTDQTSTSMSAVYSGKSGAGPTGASSGLAVTSPGSGVAYNYTTRIFSGFPSGAQSSVTLDISEACANDTSSTDGHCAVEYSTDSGSTWTSLYSGGNSSQTTYTVSIGSMTNLSTLQVSVCSQAKYDIVVPSITTETITAYDIWAVLPSAGAGAFPGFIRSALDEKIWRWRGGRRWV
jgi:hypothetical protein